MEEKMSFKISDTPSKYHTLLHKADKSPQNGYINNGEFEDAANLLATQIGVNTDSDEIKYLESQLHAEQFLYKQLKIESILSPEEEEEKYKKDIELDNSILSKDSIIEKNKFFDEAYFHKYYDIPNIFSKISPELKNNKETVIYAVNRNGLCLEFASKKMKDNIDIVKQAIKSDPSSFRFASARLKNNEDLILFAAKIDPSLIKLLKESTLSNNLDLLKQALEKDGNLLEFAPTEIKDNYDFVKIALESSPSAIKFASARLKNNEDLTIFSVQKDPLSYQWVDSSIITKYPEEYKNALSKNGSLLKYAPKELQNDEELVATAIINNPEAIEYASSKLRDSKEFILKVLNKNFKISRKNFNQFFSYLSNDLKNNNEIALMAIKKGLAYYSDLSNNLRNNREITLNCLMREPILALNNDLIKKHPDIRFLQEINVENWQKIIAENYKDQNLLILGFIKLSHRFPIIENLYSGIGGSNGFSTSTIEIPNYLKTDVLEKYFNSIQDKSELLNYLKEYTIKNDAFSLYTAYFIYSYFINPNANNTQNFIKEFNLPYTESEIHGAFLKTHYR